MRGATKADSPWSVSQSTDTNPVGIVVFRQQRGKRQGAARHGNHADAALCREVAGFAGGCRLPGTLLRSGSTPARLMDKFRGLGYYQGVNVRLLGSYVVMHEIPVEPPAQESSSPANDRLESWKEIASYLKRDVRTVQRWEKREALPVHRHLHDKLGTVYAHKREIDAWWRNRRVQLEEQDQPAGERPEPVRTLPVVLHRAAWLTAAGAFFVVAAGLALWHWRAPSPADGQPTLREVALLERGLARVSPDGRWLAYQDGASHHLLLHDLRAGRSRALVSESTDFPFAWSRDSRRLAFLTRPERYDGLFRQLETIDRITGERKILWQGAEAGLVEPHDWTPDGKQLVCRVRQPDGHFQIALLSLRDRTLQPLLNLSSVPRSLHISPDGRFVAYSAEREHNWDLFLVPTDRRNNQVRLTEHQGRDSLPFWSPDGRHIVFWRQRGSSARLFALKVDPQTGSRIGEPLMLSGPGNRSFPISITADGSLFFSRRKRSSQVFLLEVDAATGVARQPPRSSFEDETFDPAWSPDGRRIYFRKVLPAGASLLAERNIFTGDERVFRTPHSHDVSFFVRSPRSDVITFFGFDHGQQKGFYQYHASTEELRLLYKTREDPLAPASWSADGKKLLFSTWPLPDGRFPIHVFSAEEGTLQSLAFSRSRPFPEWSPNGREVAYTDKNCLVAVGGDRAQQPRPLACGPSTILPQFSYFSLGGLSWAPDGRKIAWTFHNEQQRRIEIWIVDYRTGSHQVAWAGQSDYASWPNDPAWSPDGAHIAFRMDYKPEYEIWRLSHFLPPGTGN